MEWEGCESLPGDPLVASWEEHSLNSIERKKKIKGLGQQTRWSRRHCCGTPTLPVSPPQAGRTSCREEARALQNCTKNIYSKPPPSPYPCFHSESGALISERSSPPAGARWWQRPPLPLRVKRFVWTRWTALGRLGPQGPGTIFPLQDSL